MQGGLATPCTEQHNVDYTQSESSGGGGGGGDESIT